jgi:hypothetical protein
MSIHEAIAFLESIQKVIRESIVSAHMDDLNRLMLSMQKPRDYEDLLAIGVGFIPEDGLVSFILEAVYTGWDGKDYHIRSYRGLDAQGLVVVLMYWINEQATWKDRSGVVKGLSKLL